MRSGAPRLRQAQGVPEGGQSVTRHTYHTLGHVWEKFDCQTTLLAKVALLPLARRNPELFDSGLLAEMRRRLALRAGGAEVLREFADEGPC